MKLFVYGILKTGYELDLKNCACKFLGKATLSGADLFGIGGKYEENTNPSKYHGVGLRSNKDPKRVAHGEVFEIPDHLWHWLDQIENNGFSYTRKIVQVTPEDACFHCAKDGYTNDDEYGDDCLCPEGPCCGQCKASIDAWVYEHTFPGMVYREENRIEGGIF